MSEDALTSFEGVRTGSAPAVADETAAMVWESLQQTPVSALRITVGGSDATSPETSTLLRTSSNVEAFCRLIAADVAVYAKRAEQRSPEIVSELRNLFGATAPSAGLANQERCDIFAGRYSATPGGIHREPWGNNHLVLCGEKVFRFWNGDQIDGSIGNSQIKRYSTRHGTEEYVTLESGHATPPPSLTQALGAGSYARWSAGVWHVAECASPCLSINLAYHDDTTY